MADVSRTPDETAHEHARQAQRLLATVRNSERAPKACSVILTEARGHIESALAAYATVVVEHAGDCQGCEQIPGAVHCMDEELPGRASVSPITDDTRTHLLKTWPQYWRAVQDGTKTFELRRDDRGFRVGDVLILQEWDPRWELYSGRELVRQVSYVVRDVPTFGLHDGFVVLGLGGVSAGCASTEGAQVAREQTTVHAEPIVTDDMVERVAQAWPKVWLDGDSDWRGKLRGLLSAGLAGYTPVAPAQPSGTDVDGELYWHTPLSSITAGLNLADKPFIRINGDRVDVDEVEADALAQLAAVREARRLASGSQEDSNGE